jgi:hypothetical protein
MNRNTRHVDDIPESADVATVEAFTRARIQFPGEVTLREERPTRLAWRARSYDVAERYNTELYYVGWVGEVGGPHTILVVITAGGTQFVHFLNSSDCPGGS